MKGLRDKAINRMKLQGVSKDQQEVGDRLVDWWMCGYLKYPTSSEYMLY